jgi:DNA-binding transcriptional regulator YhcF (GntR family)
MRPRRRACRLSGAREMMETTGLFITTILAAYQEMRAARFISSR